MKKLLSLLLASCMLICLIPNGIFAEDCEHVYTDWEIVANANCGYDGLKVRNCTLCGYQDKETIEATQEHDWGTVRVYKYASFKKDGEKIHYCRKCNKRAVVEIIPMLSKAYLSQDTFVYDGTEKKPTMYFVDRNNNIISSEYYKYSPASLRGRTDVGNYSCFMYFNKDGHFKGGYGWNSTRLSWKIIPKEPINKIPVSGDNALTARWSKLSKKVSSGYQVQYSRNANMTGAKKKNVVGANKTKVKIKKLKSKKKYYVRVRTYKKVNGKKVYSKWSAKKCVKTK